VTPPPLQLPVHLQNACPLLLAWPRTVSVSVPDHCATAGWFDMGITHSGGDWTDAISKNRVINWNTSCAEKGKMTSVPSLAPVTTFTVSTGGASQDVFGSSTEYKGVFGNYIEISDCIGTPLFTLQEKVYKQEGKPDEDACNKYQSCDGVIYVQYFVKDAQGKTVAMTGYLNIFQSSFDITDPNGIKIAHASRKGWEPGSYDCSDARRDWVLRYEEAPPGMWALPMSQWPLAAMMTMVAQRDEMRQSNGMVLWSSCEVVKTSLFVALAVITVILCFVVPCVTAMVCAPWFRAFFLELERDCLPRRMSKPAMYGN